MTKHTQICIYSSIVRWVLSFLLVCLSRMAYYVLQAFPILGTLRLDVAFCRICINARICILYTYTWIRRLHCRACKSPPLNLPVCWIPHRVWDTLTSGSFYLLHCSRLSGGRVSNKFCKPRSSLHCLRGRIDKMQHLTSTSPGTFRMPLSADMLCHMPTNRLLRNPCSILQWWIGRPSIEAP